MTARRTCLVLGGRGFVGSAIVRAAQAEGWDVTPAGRDDAPSLPGTSWDLVINANGNSRKYLSDREPLTDFDDSVASVARSLHHLKTPLYVFLSTVDVYPDKADPTLNREDVPIDPLRLSRYGHHKWLAEQLVRFNAPSWLILRMAGFVGPGLKKNPVYDLLTRAPLRVHPDSLYQFQHTRALADTVLDLIHQGQTNLILNAAGQGLISPREIASMIPGCILPDPDPALKPEIYDINIDRLKTYRQIPTTYDTVAAFIKDVHHGKEVLP
ncbi:MAG TPA: NAD(P)-dependent oxidoreductase [Kiritimatiellia bacterium]|nr:NAD(P)-dependent oxidoreductase [Kiritimatiellia bacterium]